MSLKKSEILAFLAPFISVVSGALAAWLIVHVHILAWFHVGPSQVAQDVASGIVFVITSALVWLSTHQHFVPIVNSLPSARPGFAPPHAKTLSLAEIIAFLAPYLSVVAGAIASWLFVHVHILGIFHVAQSGLVAAITTGLVFAVTAILTWASHTFHFLPILRARHAAPAPPVARADGEPFGMTH